MTGKTNANSHSSLQKENICTLQIQGPIKSENAITTQKMLTYGLSRSPIRELFQKIPIILLIERGRLLVCMQLRWKGKEKRHIPFFISIHDSGEE